MTHRITSLALSLSLLTAVPALADNVVLTSVKDNTLFESASGELSSGVGSSMFAGRTGQGVDDIRRALVQFDLSSIPSGSTITGAVLSIFMSHTGPAGAQPFTIHFAQESWGEGTSNSGTFGTGVASTANDATWIHRSKPGTFWSTAGGSFAAASSGSAVVDAVGSYSWGSTPGMVADVQAWLDNASTNSGWLLMGNETGILTAKRFATREASANRPTLRVDYTPPAVPIEAATWGRIKTLLKD